MAERMDPAHSFRGGLGRVGGPLAVLVAVWLTVGPIAGLVTALVVTVDRWRSRARVLPLATMSALVLVPVAWFQGSRVPLTSPGPRVLDNTLAHHVGGLAVWLLFLAALVEHHRRAYRSGYGSSAAQENSKETSS